MQKKDSLFQEFSLKNTDYSSKIIGIENKIPSISSLATNSALTAVENKIPNVSGLVKKTGYKIKINENKKRIIDHDHDEYITISGFSKLTTENFKTRLAKADLVINTDLDDKLKAISDRISSNKLKHLLIENELKKLKNI